MSDPIQRASAGADDPGKRRNWFAQRGNRKEYWIYIGIVIAVIAVIQLLRLSSAQTGLSAAIFLIQIRRFHDLGRSGWWAVALMVVEIAVGVALVVTLDETVALGAATVLGLIPIVVLGVIPGQPFENKWGPPPGRKPLAETFG